MAIYDANLVMEFSLKITEPTLSAARETLEKMVDELTPGQLIQNAVVHDVTVRSLDIDPTSSVECRKVFAVQRALAECGVRLTDDAVRGVLRVAELIP